MGGGRQTIAAMLTVEQMNHIMLEVGLGAPIELRTPEANAFREQMRAQCADLERRGIMPDTVAE
jgi:hypothetical protein